MRRSLICLMGMFMLATLLQSSYAVVYVNKAGDDSTTFTTIAGAIAASSAGEEIIVTDSPAATYNEAVVINDRILSSPNARNIITATVASGDGAVTFDGTGTISGFEVIATDAGDGVKINTSGAVTIGNCIVSQAPEYAVRAEVPDINLTITSGTQLINTLSQHGLTMGGGAANYNILIKDSTISNNNHGITLFRGGSLTIQNSTISNSLNRGFLIQAAAPSFIGEQVSLTIEGSTLSGTQNNEMMLAIQQPVDLVLRDSSVLNAAQHGIHLGGKAQQANVTIENCEFRDNGLRGLLGAIDINQGATTNPTWTISDSRFIGNGGQALSIFSTSAQPVLLSLDVDRTVFIDGTGDAAALVDVQSVDSSLTNCVLANGLFGYAHNTGTPILYHNTISLAAVDATAVFLNNTDAGELKNSIVSSPSGIAISENTSITALDNNFNVVRGTFDGDAALGANSVIGNPLLNATDLRPSFSSPAVQFGTDLGILVDIEGSPRPNPDGTNPDAGAFELGIPVNQVQHWQMFE